MSYQQSAPLSRLKGIVSPPWGYYFPLPVCGFGHTVPVFFEHGDGNKVGDTLFIQPNLQISVEASLGDSCCAGIATSCHRATTFLDVLEVHFGEKIMIRGAAI